MFMSDSFPKQLMPIIAEEPPVFVPNKWLVIFSSMSNLVGTSGSHAYTYGKDAFDVAVASVRTHFLHTKSPGASLILNVYVL